MTRRRGKSSGFPNAILKGRSADVKPTGTTKQKVNDMAMKEKHVETKKEREEKKKEKKQEREMRHQARQQSSA